MKSCVGDDLVPVRGAGLGRAGRSRWSCATGGCARRTSSSRRSPAAPASAPRRAARTSASSPPRTAGTSTSAATAASGPGTPTCSPPTCRPRTLIRLIDRFLMFYIRTADRLQRTAAWIEAMDGGLDHLRVGDRGRLARALRRARRGDGPARRRPTPTSGAPPWTTRTGCAGSSPSSTPPTYPTRRSPSSRNAASRSRRDQSPTGSEPTDGHRRTGHPRPTGGTAMTDPHADLDHRLPLRPAGAGAGRGRPGRRRAGRDLPDRTTASCSPSTTATRSPARTCCPGASSAAAADAPTVASPLHKQVYDLRTGAVPRPARAWPCAPYPVRCRDGLVEVAAATATASMR